jgi:hypothetical protein
MAKLNRDHDLHLTQLTVSAPIFVAPVATAATSPAALMAQRAITLKDASSIFGDIARYGFSSLQQVPGGVRIASADGVSVLALTGTGWQFVEDLKRSAFDPALEKLSVAIGAFLERLPGAIMVQRTVALEATWENLGQSADEYVQGRFLKDQARQVVGDVPGFAFEGGGVRLRLTRPWTTNAPPGFVVVGGGGVDALDVHIEPLYVDKAKLFIQVSGGFGPPTPDLAQVTEAARFVHEVLWDQVAGNIQMEA